MFGGVKVFKCYLNATIIIPIMYFELDNVGMESYGTVVLLDYS